MRSGLHPISNKWDFQDALHQIVAPPQRPLLVNTDISELSTQQAVKVLHDAVEGRSLVGVTMGDSRKQMGDRAFDVIAKILKAKPCEMTVNASSPVAKPSMLNGMK